MGARKKDAVMKRQILGKWCHKDVKRELGVHWMLENEEKMWENTEERPKSSRAVFGQAFVI